MKNGLVLLAVGLSVVSFGGMMRIKTEVQQMVRQREKLAETQLQLRETKRVLEAEYAMLISPLRLTDMAQPRGYEELTMYRLVSIWPHGAPTAPVSGTESKGMTLAAAFQAAKAISATSLGAAKQVSATPTVSATKVVTAAPVKDSAPPVEDDVNQGDPR